MTADEALRRGREAFERRSWDDAYTHLSTQDGLDPEDLDRLAQAAYLTGRDDEWGDAWSRAYQAFLETDRPPRAARCAFWLAFGLLNRGEEAQGGAWLARAQRAIEDQPEECAEHGYLMVPMGVRSVYAGEGEEALRIFTEAGRIGRHCDDPDLVALAHLGTGRALLRLGRIREGVASLDEAMVAITAGEVSPIVAGDVYCAVIEGCHEIFDVGRAREWTEALSRWCEAQPGLVLYRGQCLVHRSQIMQIRGAWPDAIEEARRACDRLAEPPQPAVGAAFYQRAELHRLRGEFGEAEGCYRRASELGRNPQPGLSQLRLAQGRTEDAATAIRVLMDEAHDHTTRSELLPAYVEIMLAAGDVPAAGSGADELAKIAGKLDAPFIEAMAMRAQGAVALAEGNAREAVAVLRRASKTWGGPDAPYDDARTRVLVALASRELGDDDTAVLELEAARKIFDELGAAPDLSRVQKLLGEPSGSADGLTPRELEVLELVAEGMTNRQIAGELVISEKTVARHLSNIFTKVGVSSRAAATAYAYENDLV